MPVFVRADTFDYSIQFFDVTCHCSPTNVQYFGVFIVGIFRMCLNQGNKSRCSIIYSITFAFLQYHLCFADTVKSYFQG